MEENKKGPWCEKAAKKNPYTGKMMYPCPQCGEYVEEGIEVCPHCFRVIGNNITADFKAPKWGYTETHRNYIHVAVAVSIVAFLALIAIGFAVNL